MEHVRGIPVIPTIMVLVVATVMLREIEANSKCRRVPIIFNFGDSNSDTGGIAAGYGEIFGSPSGRRHFHRPTGRLCDGRLVIDFLCESVNASYLRPYLEALGSNFSNGANFAIAGATALPQRGFPLHIQTKQFLHFYSRSLELLKQGWKDMIDEEGFKKALYTYDIGQNDLSSIMGSNVSYPQKFEQIPSILGQIENSIKTIYGLGGRNFWVHNTGPLGCLPVTLATAYHNDGRDLDAAGCLTTFNNVAKAFNSGLQSLCQSLHRKLEHATIVYTDVYSIKYDIISNYTKYGFDHGLRACCGHGGPPYNYDDKVKCLSPRCNVCSETSKHISWDGVHYTEMANGMVAAKILSGYYSKPAIKFARFCNT